VVTIKAGALTLVSSVVLSVLFAGMVLMPVVTATIEAKSVDFEPKIIDIYNQEEPVTATIRFKAAKGEDQRVVEINTTTVRLEGAVPASNNSTSTQPPEYSCDFDSRSVINILWTKISHMAYNPQGNYIVDLTITGKLYDGTDFTGTGHIQVKGKFSSGPPPPPPPSG
jgi:hypothetical protein